jgi:signal transduction histidine kinase
MEPGSKKKEKVIWFARAKVLAEAESLATQLAHFDYVCQWATPQSSFSPEWLASQVSDASLALVVDEDAAWVAVVGKALRALKPPSNGLPLLWCTADPSPAQLETVIEAGVDDIIRPQVPIAELLTRLRIRKGESFRKETLQKQLSEEAVRVATSETTVKQREEFLSVCAHDLRSPLGLIQSSLSMVLNANKIGNLSPMQEELLTRAKRQAGHAINLVNDLLDVMAYEQGLKARYLVLHRQEVVAEC